MSGIRTSFAALATVAVLATGAVLVTPLSAPAADTEVAMPSTPAEHTAEAEKYEQESLDLDAKATRHADLSARYKARMIGMSSKQSNAQHGMYKHCERLAKAYRQAAGEAREMARMHREMADMP